MKTIIGLLFILLVAGSATAQKDTSKSKSVVFDINPVGEDQTACCVVYGSMIKFRISHVNSIKLSGHMLAKGVDLDFPSPSFLSTITVPETFSPPAAPIATEQENALRILNQYKYGLTKGNVWRDKKAKYKDSIATNTAISIDLLQKKIAEMEQRTEQISQSKKDFATAYTTIIAGFRKIQQYISVENQLDSMIPDLVIRDVAALKENTRNYLAAVYGDTETGEYLLTVLNTFTEINEAYMQLKKAYEEINLPQTDSTQLSGSLKSADGKTVVTVNGAYAKTKTPIFFEKEFTYAGKIVDQLNDGKKSAEIFNKARAGVDLYHRIQKETFVVYTPAQQVVNDSAIITPSLKDVSGKTVLGFNPVSVRSKGGIKVNFSTGYLLSLTGDDSYSYYSEPGTGGTGGNVTKGILRQDKNGLTGAIGALAHVYKRSCRNVNLAATGGFSVTAAGNIGFYLGSSLLFLEKNRLAISAGLAYVKINTLDTGNLMPSASADKYVFSSAADTKINYTYLYKPAFFFGITYNLFSGK